MLPYFIYITSSFLTPNLFRYMAPFKSTKPQGRLSILLPTHHLKFYTPRYHIFLLTHFDMYKFFSKCTLTWVGIFKTQQAPTHLTFLNTTNSIKSPLDPTFTQGRLNTNHKSHTCITHKEKRPIRPVRLHRRLRPVIKTNTSNNNSDETKYTRAIT